MASILDQVWDDCKTKIEALTPTTFWSSNERFIVFNDGKSSYQMAPDNVHRHVWMGWAGGSEDLSTLSMGQALFRSTTLQIAVLYQFPTYGTPAVDRATQMAAEDTDLIMTALQALSGFPTITGGYMYHRRFLSSDINIDADAGRLELTLMFQIIYGV